MVVEKYLSILDICLTASCMACPAFHIGAALENHLLGVSSSRTVTVVRLDQTST